MKPWMGIAAGAITLLAAVVSIFAWRRKKAR